ncbi:MAG TPA: hypothetical protein VMB80_18280 [Candidatus Acidoferrum sp.]|nr:hypothetical protein [Candidatus Acidoferrum sp.]
MPLELQIIRASEFIRLGAQGRFDLAASKTALTVIARACRKRGLHQALIDLRDLRPGPKPVFDRDDLVELVQTFCRIDFTREHRLAVLYRTDPHHRVRLFAFLSVLHGWTVRAFDDFEQAVAWLSSGPEPACPARSPAEKPVAVRSPKREEDSAALPVFLAGHHPKASGGPKRAAVRMQRPAHPPTRSLRSQSR